MKLSILGLIAFSCFSAAVSASSPSSYHTTTRACTQITLIGKIDLNKADVQSLTHIVKGIGKKRAEAIVKYREEHTLFKSINDLAKVPGLGKNFVQRHRKALEDKLKIA